MRISLKTLLLMFAAVAFIFIAWLISNPFEDELYLPSHSEEWELEDIYSKEYESYKKGDKYKIVDVVSGKTLLEDIDWLPSPMRLLEDSLILFSQGSKWGYFSRNTGKVAIPARYSYAWRFSEGLAAVVKNDKIGFIDDKGNEVIDFRYPYDEDDKLSMDLAFYNGYCGMRGENRMYGIINRHGEWMTRPEYDYMLAFPSYVLVRKNYEYLRMITYDGTVVHPYLYSDVEPLCYEETKGEETSRRPTDFYSYSEGMGYGLMDAKGKRLTKPMYLGIEAIGKELFLCEQQDGKGKVLVNGKGEVVADVRDKSYSKG